MNSLAKKQSSLLLYIIIYSSTLFGSLLGMIAVFNSINSHFNVSWILAVALSLRTVFMFLSGKIGPVLFSKLDIKNTLKISEFSGIIGVLVIMFAYKYKIAALAILGVSFLGLPSGLLGQGIISIARMDLEGEDFRKLSSSLSLITGLIFIFCGLITPYLLKHVDLYNLFSFDLMSYFISLILLLFVNDQVSKKESESVESDNEFQINRKAITLKLFPALVFVGLLPLIAGQTELKNDISEKYQYLLSAGWAFEGIGILFAGILYKIQSYRNNIYLIFSLSALPLLLITIFDSMFLIIFTLSFVGISYAYNFMKVRDDSLEECSTKMSILKMNGTLMQIKSIFCIFSPLVLVNVFEFCGTQLGFIFILCIQTVLFIYILFLSKVPVGQGELLLSLD